MPCKIRWDEKYDHNIATESGGGGIRRFFLIYYETKHCKIRWEEKYDHNIATESGGGEKFCLISILCIQCLLMKGTSTCKYFFSIILHNKVMKMKKIK